jgi:DNA invertase Pin-like site-specific DNA recombinase
MKKFTRKLQKNIHNKIEICRKCLEKDATFEEIAEKIGYKVDSIPTFLDRHFPDYIKKKREEEASKREKVKSIVEEGLNNNKSLSDIARSLNYNVSSVVEFVKKYFPDYREKKKERLKQQIKTVKNLFTDGLAYNEIVKQSGISRHLVKKFLLEHCGVSLKFVNVRGAGSFDLAEISNLNDFLM